MLPEKKNVLGRGLDHLLGEAADVLLGNANPEAGVQILEMPLEKIHKSPFQPRAHFDPAMLADLVESVREKGVIQPIIVRPRGDNYEIVAGERRWQAAQQANLLTIPVIVRHFSDQQTLEIALIENIQRQDLNPIEEALGYKRLMDQFDYTQEKLSQLIGKSRSHIANMIRLLNLSPEIQEHVIHGRISMGHARALVNKSDADEIAKKIIAENLNVRQTENYQEHSGDTVDDLRMIEMDLSERLKMHVKVTMKGSAGEVRIRFMNIEQLDQLTDLLSR